MTNEEARDQVKLFVFSMCGAISNKDISALEVFEDANSKRIPEAARGQSLRCPVCDTSQEKLIKNLANPKAHKVIYCWNCGQAIYWSKNSGGDEE